LTGNSYLAAVTYYDMYPGITRHAVKIHAICKAKAMPQSYIGKIMQQYTVSVSTDN